MKDKLNRFVVGVGACLAMILRTTSGIFLNGRGIAAFLLVASVSPSARCQVPEFFGIYGVVDGKLAPLIGGRGTFTPSQHSVPVYDFQKMATETESVLVFEGGEMRFIVFDPAVADTSANLELYKLPYARNLVTRPDALAQVGGLLGDISGQSPRGQTPAASPLQKYVVAKTDALKVELLQKPVPGQTQMVQLVAGSNLQPGMYCLFAVRLQGGQQTIVGQVFEWKGQPGSAETPYCIDLAATGGLGGMMAESDARLLHPYYLAKEKYAVCNGSNTPTQSPTEMPTVIGTAGSGIAPATPAPCADYQSCMAGGRAASERAQWDSALADFQKAASLEPSKPDAWVQIGVVYLILGQYNQAPAMLDKALSVGGTFGFGVWHYKPSQYERGTFILGAKQVSFIVASQDGAFSVGPTEVSSVKSHHPPLARDAWSFGMKVGGRNYWFSYVPLGVQCQTPMSCSSAAGYGQEEAVANYVAQTIPKLASGSLAQISQPTTSAKTSLSPPAGPTTPSVPPLSSKVTSCGGALDLGYSVLLKGRLYKVKGQGASGTDQVHVFFDDKGNPVTDSSLLQPLAGAAWTRENIVASSSLRSEIATKKIALPGMIGTSRALQGYQAVQDVLARGMAEAVEAAVTGGASLSTVVPNLTGGVIRSQLMNAPKMLLTVAAQIGLQKSLDMYKQLETILPPADSVALDANNLDQVRLLYTQAQGLDLPNEALASALMPKSANNLTTQALQSVAGQLLPGLPASNAAVTLNDLWKLQTSLAQAGGTLPALQKYQENLNLVTHLSEANDRKIASWAAQAAQACSPASAESRFVTHSIGPA